MLEKILNEFTDPIGLFGLVAGIVVAISLSLTNLKKLRVYNLIGCVLFSTYGLVIGSVSVFAVNGYIAIVNAIHLIKMGKRKDIFSNIEVDADNEFLLNFLTFWRADITQFFPKFEIKNSDSIIVILRNSVPVGLLVTRALEAGRAEVILDYVSPAHRDMKNAKYFFSEQAKKLKLKGISILEVQSEIKAHKNYLGKIGFTKVSDTKFERSI